MGQSSKLSALSQPYEQAGVSGTTLCIMAETMDSVIIIIIIICFTHFVLQFQILPEFPQTLRKPLSRMNLLFESTTFIVTFSSKKYF